MSKKVIKSSNKNEKYNLKSVLDTDNIMSGVSLKTVTAIGCASIIASCDNNKDDGNKKKDKNMLKWDNFKEYQAKFGNNEDNFKNFLAKCKNLSEDEIKNLINELKKEDIDKIINSEEELKSDNGTFKLGNEVINVKEEEPKNNDTLSSFNDLSEKQKETLKEYGITTQETLDEFLEKNKELKNKKISELFDADNKAKGDFKTSLEEFKASKNNDEVKGILNSIMSDTEITSFLNYVKYINDKFENIQNSIFNDIKATKGKEKELKDKIKKFCEKYVKSDNKINYDDISKIKNIILINSIKEDIKAKLEEGQNVDNLTFTYSKGNDCIKLKIVHKDDKNKSVELEIQFDSEELFQLKEKEGKEIQLYRIKDGDEGIKYNVDEKATEIKNLFPKKKDETAMNKIKDTIKSELEKSLKDNNNDVKINSFANVAQVLKSLITTAKKLNTGKINDSSSNGKWIYDNVDSLNDLDDLFGGTQGEYIKAVTAEYDAIIKKIKTDLTAVNAGELASNAKEKKEYKMTETIESATIKDTINGHFKEGATKLVEYIPTLLTNTQKAKIEFNDSYNVTAIQLPSGFELVTDKVLEYGSNGKAADASKTDALTALKAELKNVLEDICKNNFGKDKLNNVKNKDEIKNYIDTELTYDKVKTLDDAKINNLETELKDKCGFNLKTLTTKAQIGTDIVEPLLAKVFGDKTQCKTVFTTLEALATTNVKSTGGTIELNKNDGTSSFAKIQSGTGTAINKISVDDTAAQLGVFTAIKVKIKAVNDALKKIINESDNNKKASDAFIKALKTIIGEPGIDNGVNNSDHLSLASRGKASLLFKWMYVNGDKWNDPGVQGANHHEKAIDSFVNVLACFLNKNASYKGVANGANTIQSGKIEWADGVGNTGAKSTLLNAGVGIKAQLADTNNALMIEKAKQVKIYFSDTLVPNTYADITVSALTTVAPGAQLFVKNTDIIIDDNVALDKRPMMYYIFQLVGGHDEYKHKILKKEQGLSGKLQENP